MGLFRLSDPHCGGEEGAGCRRTRGSGHRLLGGAIPRHGRIHSFSHCAGGQNDYLGGIMDTLDGSHGEPFTYLPICFQDDCQVISVRWEVADSQEPYYELIVRFDSDK